MDNAGREHYLS